MQSQLKSTMAHGFLLIELSVSLLLLAVFTFIIAQYQSMSIETGYAAIAHWKAINAVSSLIAKATVNPVVLQQKLIEEGKYILTWEKLPQKAPIMASMKDTVTYLKITASWVGYHNKKYTYTSIAGIQL